MSKVNDAMEKLRTGKPRFRLVLENDLDWFEVSICLVGQIFK